LNELFHEAVHNFPINYDLIERCYKEKMSQLNGKTLENATIFREEKVRKRWLISFFLLLTMVIGGVVFITHMSVAYGHFNHLITTNSEWKEAYDILQSRGITKEQMFEAVFANAPEEFLNLSATLSSSVFPIGLILLISWFFYYCSYKTRGTKLLSFSMYWIPSKLLLGSSFFIPMIFESFPTGFDASIPILLLFTALAIYFVFNCFQLRKINKQAKSSHGTNELVEMLKQLRWQPHACGVA